MEENDLLLQTPIWMMFPTDDPPGMTSQMDNILGECCTFVMWRNKTLNASPYMIHFVTRKAYLFKEEMPLDILVAFIIIKYYFP